jgi:aspartate ammonia-lyase
MGGGSISLHLNILELLQKDSEVSVEQLNLCQSTADVFHSAHRIAIYRETLPLLKELETLGERLRVQAAHWDALPTLSRTCLQDALSVSLGKSWAGYGFALERRRTHLGREMKELLKINLGGTVVGSSEGASPIYFEEVLKELQVITQLPLTRRLNLFDAAQNSDDLSAFHASLVQLAQVLMKFARDLRLLSSGPQGGLGELKLPKNQEGSSFFSNKTNPIIPETMIQCGARILGADTTIQVALQNAELNLNVFEGLIAIEILDSLHNLTRCVRLFHLNCVEGIQPNEKRCEELSRLRQQQKGEKGE